MALFKWSNSLSVNVSSFDKHHQKLIDLINELHAAMLSGKHMDVVGKTLRELRDYTKYHFANEEKQMLAHNYEGYGAHKEQHDLFVAKVQESITKYESGAISLSLELLNFLRDWLKGHIQGTDKLYSTFFNSRGVS